MREVRRSCERVARRSSFVDINEAAIYDFVFEVDKAELDASDMEDFPLDDEYDAEQIAAFVMIQNAINFSFWGNPKWQMFLEGDYRDGGQGLYLALKEAIDSDISLLIPSVLEHLDRQDLEEIFSGNIEIPLLDERLVRLNKLGAAVIDIYDGSFLNILEESRFEAQRIATELVERIPEVFDDTARYKGERVAFHKRAQLVPADIDGIGKYHQSAPQIQSLDKLTAMADYKIPQVLRHRGILEYSQELSEVVDQQIEIAPGSECEVEIRANTIVAVRLIAKGLTERFGKPVTDNQVDRLLWIRGQLVKSFARPYHRTRTVAY